MHIMASTMALSAVEYVSENGEVLGESFYVEQVPSTDYSTSIINLNVDSIADLLGCSVPDLTLQATDAYGVLTDKGTAGNGGFWLTQNGIVCSWGSSAYFFVEPVVVSDYSRLNIGQMPGSAVIGEEGHALMYLTSGNSYYELDITLAIKQDEVVVESDFENVATRNYTIQALDADYTWSTNSASIPFADIYNLIGTVEPVLYALNMESVATETGEKY